MGVLACACTAEPPDPSIALLATHAGVGTPGPDTSNKYWNNPAAAALGKKLYFDKDFSGIEVAADMLYKPMTTPGRAAMGARIGVSCNSCHDVTMGGSDHTSDPPGSRVSFGGGAYDVNGEQTINAAFDDIVYWNGRNDTLWSQIVAVEESHVSVNGSRMRVAWRLADAYRAEYTALFPDYPLPAQLDSITAQKARLDPDGSCTLVAGACPVDFCVMNTIANACLPRFPLEGRPGFVLPAQQPTCDWGSTDSPRQPYGDAYDCMQLADQLAITRVYVNFAKAIEAYEFTLVSKNSLFDQWADAGFKAGLLGASPERGAKLFVGKAACAECHTGPEFTDYKFHNIGVPQLGAYVPTTASCHAGDFATGGCDCTTDDRFSPENCLPIGARDGLRKLAANKFRRDSVWSDDADCQSHYTLHTDPNYAAENPAQCDGRIAYYSVTLDDSLRGAWRTPSLRDVALTAPYMHDGIYATLHDQMVHYNKGGIVPDVGGEVNGTIDAKIKVLDLTDAELDDLVAFLQTLTGTVDPAVTSTPTVPADSPF